MALNDLLSMAWHGLDVIHFAICTPVLCLKGVHVRAGARPSDDGLEITVTWDSDKYTASIPNSLLKANEHCRLKLIEFYESKIKAVKRK